MTRLFIEGQELDLSQGLSQQITYAIDDLQNLDSKATTFSKTIVLPGTTRNNGLLGNIFDFNHANLTDDALRNVGYNFNAARQARCWIEVNGLQIVKGVFRMLEIIIDKGGIEYECAVFGELGGFVAALGNKRLEDLDFSAYDHTYAVSGITGSWADWNAGQGYYYPLIDYGGVSVNKSDYSYRTFRPALFMREYINKIITGAGYTWESAFFDTNFFKRLIVPNNQKELFIPKNQLFFTTGNPTYSSGQVSQLGVQTTETEGPINIPSFVGGLFTTSDNVEFTYSGTAANLNINARFFANYDIVPLGGGNRYSISIRFELLKNGDLAYWNGRTYGRQGQGGSNFYVDLNTVISLAPGDVIKFRLLITVVTPPVVIGGGAKWAVNVNGVGVTIDSQVPILSPAELGDTIRFREIMPRNIFQRDFFTSVLKMFNLLVTEDRVREKHLIIEPWVDFFNTSPGSYLDWSGKLDRSRPVRIKPMSEINARYYELAYKPDSDFYNDEYKKKYNQGYGNRVYDNRLDFAKETQKVEVIFAATPLVGYEGEDKVVSTIMKRNNALEEKIEHVIRIMQAKLIEGVSSWDIMNKATVLATEVDYPYAGHLDDPDAPNADINFGVPVQLYFELASGNLANNLFNAYYSPYFAEIVDKDSRLITGHFYLTEQDMYDLDFARFIYLDGGLYRLSKVVDYVPGGNDVTQVELLRVIYTTY